MNEPFPIEKARKLRLRRAAALDMVKVGTLELREVLSDPPGSLVGVDVWALLLATPGLGEATAKKVLQESHIWPHTKLRDLVQVERKLLLSKLPERIK